jgi:uncharacterized protein (TIGR02147 family)
MMTGCPPSSGSLSASASDSSTSPGQPAPPAKVNVFEFAEYREFLKAFYEAKKAANSNYCMSTFVRRAGLGANSRGYLKLVIEGKRSLTPHTLRRFIDALGLEAREAAHFENLVYFNQSKTARDREYYFRKLEGSSPRRQTPQFELLRSHYRYLSNWYYVAIRELVALEDFVEDPAWIAAQLRGKITRKNAVDALSDLINLELLKRDENGRLRQSEPLVKFRGEGFNVLVDKLHQEMIQRASEALASDHYDDVDASFVTLSLERSRIPEIKRVIEEFRDRLTQQFGLGPTRADSVVQVNVQLFELTSPRRTRGMTKQEISK